MTKIWDWLMDVLYALAVVAIGWLPNSPFASLDFSKDLGTGIFPTVMGWINYFIPINIIVGVLASYLTCVGIWYAARWVLRLTRYID